ncbi:hypothetical protein SNE40_009161 [Patella caerulea]|uniref:Uncharacterized protein n=1 Tax=Patella caerulea TaxID=87958 RepID=A0AAN8PPT6_PATCE
MKSATIILAFAVALCVMFQVSDAAIARCRCGGRCGTFTCSNPDTVKGCNCASCTCTRGNIGFRKCCADDCGFFNSKKCFRCKPYQSCSCSGCR